MVQKSIIGCHIIPLHEVRPLRKLNVWEREPFLRYCKGLGKVTFTGSFLRLGKMTLRNGH